jgi:hypothetical protein
VRGDCSHALENWNLPKKRLFSSHSMATTCSTFQIKRELRGCETIEMRLSFDISAMLLTAPISYMHILLRLILIFIIALKREMG